jgi:hypothetical protein
MYKVLAAIKDFKPVYIIKQTSNDGSANNLLLENNRGDRLMFTTDNVVV